MSFLRNGFSSLPALRLNRSGLPDRKTDTRFGSRFFRSRCRHGARRKRYLSFRLILKKRTVSRLESFTKISGAGSGPPPVDQCYRSNTESVFHSVTVPFNNNCLAMMNSPFDNGLGNGCIPPTELRSRRAELCPFDNGLGNGCILKYFHPLTVRTVGGDNHRAALIPSGNNLEEQSGGG